MNRTWWLVRPRFAAPTGLTLAAAAAGVVVVAALCAATTAPSAAVVRLVALALWSAAVGAVGDLVAAAATAVIAWTVLNGFLVNQRGELTWHGSADAVRLGVLLGAAAASWLAVLTRRVLRHRLEIVRMRSWLSGDVLASPVPPLTSIPPYKEASSSG
ncbi:hypothetical protein KZZ52_33145 [Dactylosporangium sp. AC04546]|uniref:hypothetical protein n=1 Tax=Dactylosporangium sp. AC04546 TaxID=2862460 RepID=UPI001EE08755|nr:hypothetical protein [Dactylosporangium sp. AC04546]WVK78831.1 hypothetical protein KZZ52_33145 [Dactylosporangium sp. AC04546]